MRPDWVISTAIYGVFWLITLHMLEFLPVNCVSLNSFSEGRLFAERAKQGLKQAEGSAPLHGPVVSRASNSAAASRRRPLPHHRLKSAHWGSQSRNQQKASTWGSPATTDHAAVNHPRG